MIFNEDVTKWRWDGELFHALLCDPPYHLTSITKRFGKKGSAPAKYGKDGAFWRASKGFLNKEWDGGDVAFRPETWAHFWDMLYPGAFCMAFGGSRTAHRMAVAIEDANFIIHPMIGWVYGSGFCKATRVDTQIDKMAGVEIKRGKAAVVAGAGDRKDLQEYEPLDGTKLHNATTSLAQAWEGHRYGLQALKPALEPIIVFQKPYDGKPVECMVETGAGALNIEGGRIGKNAGWSYPNGAGGLYSKDYQQESKIASDWNSFSTKEDNKPVEATSGRWPANFLLTHSPDCQCIGTQDSDSYTINRFKDGAKPFGNGAGHEYASEIVEGGKMSIWECVEGCPIRRLDLQTGKSKSNLRRTPDKKHGGLIYGWANYETDESHVQTRGHNDSGTASRFFKQTSWQLEEADPFIYSAKCSQSERNAGLEDKCTHPTLKPLSLCKYLATLLLPPAMYAPRRILIPFCGVMSEGIGAYLAGWETVIGIELEAEYIPIAEARWAHWTKPADQPSLLD